MWSKEKLNFLNAKEPVHLLCLKLHSFMLCCVCICYISPVSVLCNRGNPWTYNGGMSNTYKVPHMIILYHLNGGQQWLFSLYNNTLSARCFFSPDKWMTISAVVVEYSHFLCMVMPFFFFFLMSKAKVYYKQFFVWECFITL